MMSCFPLAACFQDSLSLTCNSLRMMYLGVELFKNPTWSLLSCFDVYITGFHQIWKVSAQFLPVFSCWLWRSKLPCCGGPYDRRWQVACMSWERPLLTVGKKAGTSAQHLEGTLWIWPRSCELEGAQASEEIEDSLRQHLHFSLLRPWVDNPGTHARLLSHKTVR